MQFYGKAAAEVLGAYAVMLCSCLSSSCSGTSVRNSVVVSIAVVIESGQPAPFSYGVSVPIICKRIRDGQLRQHLINWLSAAYCGRVLAVVGCGAAPNYWVLIGCRMLVGVGEASFVALAAPFIGDRALAAGQSVE